MPSISPVITIPLQKSLTTLIKRLTVELRTQHKQNPAYRQAFDILLLACQNPKNVLVKKVELEEMLIQHLMTERFLRLIFQESPVLTQNALAIHMEKTLQTLPLDRDTLLAPLQQLYESVGATLELAPWREKRQLFSALYEQLFRVFSPEQTRSFGVFYTPPEVVHFMSQSVDLLLQRHFNLSLGSPQVKILDPCTGTGAFPLALMDLLTDPETLETQYAESLFCNEVLLYPYYLASLLIEQEYFRRIGVYRPFEGISYVDTLQEQAPSILPGNDVRIDRQRQANIMVVLGNPPYNLTRKHPEWAIDQRIEDTYLSSAQEKMRNHYYYDYIRFFRWATDRLKGQAGMICFVTNNTFTFGSSLDGLRTTLSNEFTHIYHLDLGGNSRQGDLFGNVMNNRIGTGVTVLIRTCPYEDQKDRPAQISYHSIAASHLNKEARLSLLATLESFAPLTEQDHWYQPSDASTSWKQTQEHLDRQTWIPLGSSQTKKIALLDASVIFRFSGGGIKTNRDQWVYDSSRDELATKMQYFIAHYNESIERWQKSTQKESFHSLAASEIPWEQGLEQQAKRGKRAVYSEQWIRESLYRPFVKKYFYADPLFSARYGVQLQIFPHEKAEQENSVILLPGKGNRQAFGCFASTRLSTMDMGIEKAISFPSSFYDEQGERQENITDWALAHFQQHYGADISKQDIFFYVYALLHHPAYRAHIASSPFSGSPHIPLVATPGTFTSVVQYGNQLFTLHTRYHELPSYPLTTQSRKDLPVESSSYTIGNSVACKWALDQVQKAEEGQDFTLAGQVITACQETVRIMHELENMAPETTWIVQEEGSDILKSDEGGKVSAPVDWKVLLYTLAVLLLRLIFLPRPPK